MASNYFSRRAMKSARLFATAIICATTYASRGQAGNSVTVASDVLISSHGDTILGETDPARPITVVLALPSRDPAGAAAFVTAVTTPGSPLFHRYVTPGQYAARFGASSADYTALLAWAKASGLAPGEFFAARTVLPLTGTASSLQAAFGITFHDYRKPSGEIYYAADRAPRLPAEIAGKVSGVIGLSSYSHFTPLLRRLPQGAHPNLSGTGPGGGFAAADLRSIYDIRPQCCGKASQQIALFEEGGFQPSDITAYRQQMHIPEVPVTARSVDGSNLGINDPGIELEAVLDIDMVLAANPAVKQITVYEDTVGSFQGALIDSLAAMANDDSAQIISISYGQDEALQTAVPIAAENTIFTQMAAQGQAVFVSAGEPECVRSRIAAAGHRGWRHHGDYRPRRALLRRASLERTRRGPGRHRRRHQHCLGHTRLSARQRRVGGEGQSRIEHISKRAGCCHRGRSGDRGCGLFPDQWRLERDWRHQRRRTALGRHL
jgi:hypothetical protein